MEDEVVVVFLLKGKERKEGQTGAASHVQRPSLGKAIPGGVTVTARETGNVASGEEGSSWPVDTIRCFRKTHRQVWEIKINKKKVVSLWY